MTDLSATTLVVIDDDPEVLRATARILQQAGYTVITGASAAEAVALTRRHLPAILLLDVMLPDGNGIDVARQLKGEAGLTGVFVILLSGAKTSGEDQAAGLASGLADGYIARPIGKAELLARVDAMLRLRTVQLELEQHRNHLEELVRSRTAELALAKDAAEAASRAKSAFLATMSHELRTPLNAILGMGYLVGRKVAEPKLRGQVDTIRSAGQQLLNMVDQILDMTRLEANTLTIEVSDFALAPVLDAPAKAWRERAAAKGLDFALEIDPALPPVLRGDPQRLGQMLAILVDNAIKFSDTGRIELRVRLMETGEDGLLLRFEVADQGIGIDAAQQAMLFNSFAQADSSTTRKYGGIGISLSICKRLAELMGGKVGAGGTPNAGSTFWFSARLLRGDDIAATAVAHSLPAELADAAPTAVAKAAPPLTADALKTVLDQLDALLALGDADAIALFEQHAAELHATLGEPCARLSHEIRGFAFEAARETVETLR